MLVDPGQLDAEAAGDALAVRAVAGPDGDGAAAAWRARSRASSERGLDDGEHGPGPRRRRGRRTVAGSTACHRRPRCRGRAGRRRAGRRGRRLHAPQPTRRGTDGTTTARSTATRPWPPAAKAAHSAPATARSSGAPSSTSIVRLAAPRARRTRTVDTPLEVARRGRRRRCSARRGRRRARARRRAAAPTSGGRSEHDAVAGQHGRGALEHGLGPRRAGAAADADDAARRLEEHAAAAGAQRGRPRRAAVAQRLGAVVGELVQPADAREQLGQQRLRARHARSPREHPREVRRPRRGPPGRPAQVARPRRRQGRAPTAAWGSAARAAAAARASAGTDARAYATRWP